MANNGVLEPSMAQNGARRLPEGSLPDHAPVNMSTQNPRMSRKRTKTGCLTCRKRRIKCGEERPICCNCVKSKRNCEGYNQRVVFKDPMNAFRPTGSGTQHTSGNGASFGHVAMQGGPIPHYSRTLSASNSSQAPLPEIRPKPLYQDGQNGPDGGLVAAAYNGAPDYPYTAFDPAQFTPPYPPGEQPPRQRQLYDARYGLIDKSRVTPGEYDLAYPIPGQRLSPHFPNTANSLENVNGLTRSNNQQPTDVWPDSQGQNGQIHFPFGTALQNRVNQFQQSGDQTMPSNLTNGPLDTAQYLQRQSDPQQATTQCSQLEGDGWILVDSENKPWNLSAQSVLERSMQNGWLVNNGRNPTINGRGLTNGYSSSGDSQQYYLDPKAALEVQSIPYTQTMLLEEPEDDYYDVDSDGDPEFGNQKVNKPRDHQSDIGLMMAMSPNQDDVGLRSFTAFLNEPNVLATYRPTATASPLMDPQTARVFCHFVTSTGPSLSIYERHPNNPSVMFTGSPVPPSQQALWTYTLPTLALNHQGLLHSMLALASLHIAKLQHTSPTPSLKHYHYALRRVARAVGLPSRRQEIATFAASLLLGFYEVMTAEHQKWNSHLAGASQLAMEIDFTDMTRRIKAMRLQSELNQKSQYNVANGSAYFQYYNNFEYSDDLVSGHDKDVDEDLVSTIMGWKIRYGELGHVIDNSDSADAGLKPLTAKEVENYRLQCDLFWWYCKQDVYQSIISSNCLLMPYERWGHCPPRAPVGRLDAIYGTMDHLILLMGRIAEFAGKDQVRKRDVVKANGGIWMPRPGMFPPGMFPGPPPGAPQHTSAGGAGGQPTMPFGVPTGQGQPNTGPSPSSQYPPPMYGMAPSAVPQRMPEAFSESPDMSHTGMPQIEDFELEGATVAAEAEWNGIKTAFEALEQRLGSDFQPLSPEYMQPLSTPFGPALYYRTYSMACIWALYYTGRIITARVHPSMPPAAMVAAGVAAFQTRGWAKLIGRVCAGLQPTNTNTTTQLNPSLGAALIESSLCLFFAGVQYQDAGQRGWTITKLRDIARLTGWQSSAAIASGCETAWTKAAEAGKGPPYQRTMDPTAKDDRVAGRRPDLNGGPPKDNNDRRFITVNAGARVHWALGLLSVEEDMQKLNLDN